jgi:transposase-like protein
MAKKIRRRKFSAAEKVAILKRHLVEKEAVSAICEELHILTHFGRPELTASAT